jgi:hypothetical protein
MKPVKIVFFIALSIIIFIQGLSAQNNAGNSKTKGIIIKHIQNIKNNNPVPNSSVYFGYFDIIKSVWVTEKETTDAAGIANFKIPLRDDGSSYCFIYSISESEFGKILDKAKSKKILLQRIPAMDKGDYLEIWVDDNNMTERKKGMVQLWSE